MKNEKEIIESLVAGGVIGAALGALITDNKNGAALGALAGAAIAATLKANEDAQKTNLPMIIEDKGILYEVLPNGQRRFIRAINKPLNKPLKKFKLGR